ncbi:Myosin-6 [Hondaea fermentalgiana]|uniref:Myosin-6 n=1 Tax=Hondaea fermentalgiana TaxID=2315210 RepID=A0A2R5GM76_9STRA|nr:Myosin-6 [Hondaea fermentalgiana]|eukprot:GBG30838.1 Myosin-6 [Hondaea fermentalgiana]
MGRGKTKTWDLRQVLLGFYTEYAPEKVPDLDRVITHFTGREEDLIETLEEKYSVVFHRDGTFEDVILDDEDDYLDDDDDEYTEVDDDDTYDLVDDIDDDDDYSDDEIDPEIEEELNFSLKSEKAKAADLARAAAAIIQARPPRPRTITETRKSKERKLKRSSKDKARRPSKASAKGSKRTSKSGRRPSGKSLKSSKSSTSKAGLKANRGLGYVDVSISVAEKAKQLSKAGALVWVRDTDEAWVPGVISKETATQGCVNVEVGGRGRGAVVTAEPDDVEPILESESTLYKVDDLTKLKALHEPALLQALQDRFARDRIYTYTGPILLAVNPFKTLDIYGKETASRYMEASKGFTSSGDRLKAVDLPPHVYKLADDAYRALIERNGRNQSILVSGESGAGKTETVKIVLNYLSYVSSIGRKHGGRAYAAERVLRANPVLEAFGNAKTLRNDNSSRFGKFIQVMFDENKGDLKGAYVETYLLEKARVVHQTSGERNYHIFYELAAGASAEQKRRWRFPKSLKSCRYTGQSGTMRRSDIDDLAQFQTTVGAMEVLNFQPSDIERIFRSVVAVLHLGNIDFKEHTSREGIPTAKIVNEQESVDIAAELLGVDAGEVARVLTERVISVGRGETVVKAMSLAEAEDARDALAMNLYERIFGWIVWRTNLSIGMDDKQYEAMLARQEQQRQYLERARRRGEEEDVADAPVAPAATAASSSGGSSLNPFRASVNRAFAQALSVSGLGKKADANREPSQDYLIGCLDIFGFEVFEVNSFEQLCINYTNEQLQQQFNEFVFRYEQEEYVREGIDWTFVEFPDNSECIAMIESKPIGLLSLIDEECLWPQGTDATLLTKLYSNLPKKYPEHFLVKRSDRISSSFTVCHFAGQVSYCIDGFCIKNKNELRQEAVDVLRSSSDRLVSMLLPASAEAAAGGADMAAHFDSLMSDGGKGPRRARGASLSAAPPQQRGTKLLKTTVGSHFKNQLASAMAVIRASDPHYVRCLKPNAANKAGRFERVPMVNQLRYSGVIELVRVTKAGYPSRFTLGDFVERFAVLGFGLRKAAKEGMKLAKSGDRKAQRAVCEKICKNIKLKHGVDYQIGQTKMFLRQATLSYIEMKKAERTYDSIVRIQRAFRRHRAEFRERYAALVIQRNVRGYLVRLESELVLERRALAAEIIQTNPHFQRWLDYVMRKSRAERRRRRRRAEQQRFKFSWHMPPWVENNRDVLVWLVPIVGLYFLPTLLGIVGMVVRHLNLMPIFAAMIAAGTLMGGAGSEYLEEMIMQFRSAMTAPSSSRRKSKAKKARRATRRAVAPPPSRRRSGASSRSKGKRRSLRDDPRSSLRRVQVSEKFNARAIKLRNEKAKQKRASQAFEMPKVTPKFRGLRGKARK